MTTTINFSENFQVFKICVKTLTNFFKTLDVFLNVFVVPEYFPKTIYSHTIKIGMNMKNYMKRLGISMLSFKILRLIISFSLDHKSFYTELGD